VITFFFLSMSTCDVTVCRRTQWTTWSGNYQVRQNIGDFEVENTNWRRWKPNPGYMSASDWSFLDRL